jgi:hypothetical protein
MSGNETRMPVDFSGPIANYVGLIRQRRPPYYDIVQYLLQEMDFHYKNSGVTEVTYTINPRILQEEIEKRVKNEKLTTRNVCRTILAMLYEAKFEEDNQFWVTTTSSGRRNYHVKVNNRTLDSLSRIL